MKLSLVNAAVADGRSTIGKREAISFAIFHLLLCVSFLLAFVSKMCYVQKISARYIAFLSVTVHSTISPSLRSLPLHFPDFPASVWSLNCCQKPPSILQNLWIFSRIEKKKFLSFFFSVSFFTRFLQQNSEEQRIQRTCAFQCLTSTRIKKKKEWK